MKDITRSTRDFPEIAICGVARAEKVQHGSELQLTTSIAGCEGACPDAFMEGMAASFDMPRIDASLEGRQQSADASWAPQIFWTHVTVAKAG